MREALIKAREETGLTQAKIAENIGVSRSFYGLIETGARNPSYGLAKSIAWELKKSVSDLFFELDSFRMKPNKNCGNDTPDQGPAA